MEDGSCKKDFLGKLSEKELELFKNNSSHVHFLPGETIIKQGALAHHVIYVKSGLVKQFVQSGVNKQINLRLLNGGDFMAFFIIFNEHKYPYTASAIQETEVCMIEKETLKQHLLNNPEFALKMTAKNYQRENRYLEIINNLSFKQMRGKLASTILYLSSDKFKDDPVFDYLTRQDIADFASITLESAIKFIKEFEREEIIKLNNKKIEIVSIEKLRNLSIVG